MRPYLTQFIHTAARTNPDGECLVFDEKHTSNQEFRDAVATVAGALELSGVEAGERVAVLSLNSDRMIELLYGAMWHGAVAAPLNIRWTSSEVVYAMNDCGATVLCIDDPFVPMLGDIVDGVGSVREVWYLGDGEAPHGTTPLTSVTAAAEPSPDAGRTGDDLAFVLYTGGTTGFPKGVMVTHEGLWSATMGMLAAGCGPGARYLNAAPLFHIGGIQMMCGHFLNAGGAQVILPAFDPGRVLQAIETSSITDVFLVPTMLQMVLAHPDFAQADLGSLETIFYGAAPMPPALLQLAIDTLGDVRFVQGYGMTETALTVMLPPRFYEPAARAADKTGSVGRALPGAEIAIRDPAGTELPPGEIGEVTMRGPAITAGYWGQPDLTGETIRDGWLFSGDAGFLDDEGFLYLVDRIKDMIITGGENVYSSEVERVVGAHPGVAQVAVIGIPHAQWGEQVHAVIVANDPVPDEESLMTHCRSQLASFKCPRSFSFVDQLPLSAAGKVLKTTLREQHPAAPAGG